MVIMNGLELRHKLEELLEELKYVVAQEMIAEDEGGDPSYYMPPGYLIESQLVKDNILKMCDEILEIG